MIPAARPYRVLFARDRLVGAVDLDRRDRAERLHLRELRVLGTSVRSVAW